jgi:hypothetical protein
MGLWHFGQRFLLKDVDMAELLDYSIRPLKKMNQEAVPVFG